MASYRSRSRAFRSRRARQIAAKHLRAERSVFFRRLGIEALENRRLLTVTAQTLHSFNGTDGENPVANLTLDGSTLFGTTERNEGGGDGNVFSINTDGTGFRVLHTFSYTDGAKPLADLTLVGSTLFGTTSDGGGGFDGGTIFSINTDGSGFQVLHAFSGSNKQPFSPEAGLTLVGSTLFGTTGVGGSGGFGDGTVFSINTDGSNFQTLHSFSDTDGYEPEAALTLAGSTLFGTTDAGGSNEDGTVFSINTDGSGFQVLHSFADDADGKSPLAGLTLVGSTLFGTTWQTDALVATDGTVFSINTDGSNFQTLHSFGDADGIHPLAGLTPDGSTLFGTTDSGTVFSMNTDGSDFQVLHTFTPIEAGLTLSGSTLFGTTVYGGSDGYGTVFSLTTGQSVASDALIITTEPPVSAVAGSQFGMQVSAEGAGGTVDQSFNGNVTAALASNPAGGSLGGIVTVAAVSGVATFSGLTLNKVGSGYTLAVTSGTLTSTTSSAISVTSSAATSSSLYASDDGGELYTVDPATGQVTVIGEMSTDMSDLAFSPDGVLYGIDPQSSLYTIDPATAVTTFVGNLGVGVNSLVFSPSGTLYAANSNLYSVSTSTGAASLIGNLGGYSSAGDLAFDNLGRLFLSTTGGQLVQVDPSTGSATLIGPIGFSNVYGLAYGPDDQMYGLSDSSDQIFTINLNTGAGTLESDFGGQGVFGVDGAAFAPVAAMRLVITGQPASTVTAGSGFGFTVTAEDAQGNVLSGFNGSVTVALANNPGGGTLGGMLTVAASNGVASFSGLTLNKAGSGYTLAVTSGSFAPTISSAISVTAAAVTLTLYVHSGNASGPLLSGAQVTGQYADGTAFSGITGAGGTLTLTAAPGNWQFSVTDAGYPTNFWSQAITATGTANVFLLQQVPTNALHLAFIQQPPSVTSGTTLFDAAVTVAIEDSANNVVTSDDSNVTFVLNPGNETLASVAAVNGVATLSDFDLNSTGTFTLQAKDGGDTPVTSQDFTITGMTGDPSRDQLIIAIQDLQQAIIAYQQADISVMSYGDAALVKYFADNASLAENAKSLGLTIAEAVATVSSGSIAGLQEIASRLAPAATKAESDVLEDLASGLVQDIATTGMQWITNALETIIATGQATYGTTSLTLSQWQSLIQNQLETNLASVLVDTATLGNNFIASLPQTLPTTFPTAAVIDSLNGLTVEIGAVTPKIGATAQENEIAWSVPGAQVLAPVVEQGSLTQENLDPVLLGVSGKVAQGLPSVAAAAGTVSTINTVISDSTAVWTIGGALAKVVFLPTVVGEAAVEGLYWPGLQSLQAVSDVSTVADLAANDYAEWQQFSALVTVCSDVSLAHDWFSVLGTQITTMTTASGASYSTNLSVGSLYIPNVTSGWFDSHAQANGTVTITNTADIDGEATGILSIYSYNSKTGAQSLVEQVADSNGVVDIPANRSKQLKFTFNIPDGDLLFSSDYYAACTIIDTAGVACGVALDTTFQASSTLTSAVDELGQTILTGTLAAGESVASWVQTASNAVKAEFDLDYPGSEMNLDLYDSAGDHVGYNYATGQIDLGIPGAQYYPGAPGSPERIDVPVSGNGQYYVVATALQTSGLESVSVTMNEFAAHAATLAASASRIDASVAAGGPAAFDLGIGEIGGQENLTGVGLSISNLVGPGGALIPNSAFTFNAPPATIPAGAQSDVTFRLTAPTVIGSYQGTIQVTSDSGSETVPIQLEVGQVGTVTIDDSSSSSSDNVGITFVDATHYSVSVNGVATTYSTLTDNKFVYDSPTVAFSEVIFDDPTGVYSAVQSLAGTTLVNSSGFEADLNHVSNLYVYLTSSGSTATVNVADGGTSSNNFVVVDTSKKYSNQNYSYIADPGTGAYSELSGFDAETITGSAGTTYAYIYSTSNASTVASPTQTTFTVGGVTSTLSNFPQVYVVGAADGTDSVTLDSSGGTFVGTPSFNYVGGTAGGTSFLLGALYAANVTAQASTGGKDTAVFYSYPHDTFSGTPGTSSLTGSTTNVAGSSVNFAAQALGFNSVSVFESGGGTDVANLTSPGHSSFFGTPTASIFTVGANTITVDTFFTPSGGQPTAVPSTIVVTGNHDGTDQASISDVTGSNALVVGGSSAVLTTSLGSVTINKFGSVTANQKNGTDDTVHQTAIDFALQTVGNWTSD